MKYILYKYVKNQEILYIGQTTQDLKHRHNQHCSDNPIFKEMQLFYVEIQSKNQLDLLEKIYISKYKPQLNKVHLQALPENIKFQDNLKFILYTDEKKAPQIHKKEIKNNNSISLNLEALSLAHSLISSQTEENQAKRKIYGLKEFRIILLFYIKSKIHNMPITEVCIKDIEYIRFYNLNDVRNLEVKKYNFLKREGELIYLKVENIDYLDEELSKENIDSLIKLGKSSSKYTPIVYYFLKKYNNWFDIESFKKQYEIPYKETRDLKHNIISPALQDLNLKIVKETTKGRKILKILIADKDNYELEEGQI